MRSKLKRYWFSDTGKDGYENRTSPLFKTKSQADKYFKENLRNRPHGSYPKQGKVPRDVAKKGEKS